MTRDGLRALLLTSPLVAGAACGGDVVSDGDDPIRQPGPGADGGDDAGTDDEPPRVDGEGDCVETADFFREKVWAPFMSTQCFACHNPAGQARHTDLVLQPVDVPGYLEANLATLRDVARLEIDGESLLLLKPTGAVEHGGAQQLVDGDDRHEALAQLVNLLEHPVHCADDGDYAEFFAGVELLDLDATLRRAVFALAGRFPTQEERDAVSAGGEGALATVLDAVMHEPTFSTRMMEIYNDQLLTDAYLPGTKALDLLDPDDYPSAFWFSNMTGAAMTTAQNRSNDALAREPLELVKWVVENDRPFTDIVAADYTVANPFLARVYGLDLGIFADENDPAEWKQVKLEAVPHAGVLTTPVFLNRYPTTDTNRNRGRALVTLQYFLATDVLRLGARPLDGEAVSEHNPTMYDYACTSCHEILDPVAGAFGNWDDLGRYRPQPWYQDMRPPGLGDDVIPGEMIETSLSWLGAEIAEDPRFARAVVHTLYRGLTGQKPLDEPTDPSAPDYAARIRAFEVQDYVFKGVAQSFIDSGYDVRQLITELVQTPYFRAVNVEAVDEARALELQDLGAVQLVTPEQLDRRISAATGYTWSDENGALLPLSRPYHLMYGGIDSEAVIERFGELNGVMANIADRMSNEVACLVTSQDFAKPASARLLFPYVEVDDLPGAGDDAIRDNIVFLHEQLLGETLAPDDPEIERTVALFHDVIADGQSGIAAAEYAATLIAPCRAVNDATTGEPFAVPVVDDPDYTVRAWMAVVSAMLGDFGFLYE
jgi:hypothetical protein